MARIAMVVTNACAPDPRVERHARWLVEEGHSVEIYAWDRGLKHPLNESLNGYDILRTRIGSSPSVGSFTSWKNKKKFISKLNISADLLILNDTDTANVNFSGKIILDIHDMAHTWPLMRGNSILHRYASRKMLKDAKTIMKKSSMIITSAPGFQDWIKSEGHHSKVVMNRRNASHLERIDEKVIGYFGRIRDFESMKIMIEASKIAGFRVITAGDGLAAERMVEEYPEIDYRGPFTEEQLPALIGEISVMFAMYSTERGNIMQGAIPTKMLDAAAFGRPSIVNSDTPMGILCSNEKLGVTAPFNNLEEIAKGMVKAHSMEINNVKGDDREVLVQVVTNLLD